MIRFAGFVGLVAVGLTLMRLSDLPNLPWWADFGVFVVGWMIVNETVRADERHKHGL